MNSRNFMFRGRYGHWTNEKDRSYLRRQWPCNLPAREKVDFKMSEMVYVGEAAPGR